ncbi:hypothetical protein ADICYQ_2338 [Cyclobacterium qasimii M12-11B]|uniref:Uncharacterized protein n=1 Tax=Cyclobacterium qasimii M12-11B TaxID=641524 RepID=S7VF48_9BACT|nr:hypothetical protein ADICYQ_2338 [Cyclobacterium qasimii M12-11B]
MIGAFSLSNSGFWVKIPMEELHLYWRKLKIDFAARAVSEIL